MTKEKKYKPLNDWFQKYSGMLIVVIAALLLGISLTTLYYYSHEGIRQVAKQRSENKLSKTSLRIRMVMDVVEVAAKNISWAVENSLDEPESMYTHLEKLVSNNRNIIGAGVGFVSDYYPQKGRWYEPYTAKSPDNRTENRQLGSKSHNYLEADWFKIVMKNDSCFWSEPYYDESGARALVATFSQPIHDKTGKTIAVLGTDVSLDWLSHLIKITDDSINYKSEYVLLSKEGRIMVCPVDSMVMTKYSLENMAKVNDTIAASINRKMLAGESGHAVVWSKNGDKTYAYYGPVDKRTGWSMAVFQKDKDIFAKLRAMTYKLLLLTIGGLIMLGIIIWRSARQAKSLQRINAEKERIGSELRIASNIQQSMIPKVFPPYPERDDVEIFGLLESAKEVGGDLFDFYIRDEKLFFCIGDVSGKGVPASLVMAVTRSLFRTVSAHEANVTRIVEIMNESMSDMNSSSMFVTFFLGILDLPTGRLRYCNAGHDAPILIDAKANLINDEISNKVESLPVVPNIPLGIMQNFKYEGQETTINPEMSIFLYTDGLTEAEDIEHRQFGKERMIDVAAKTLDRKHKTVDNDDPQNLLNVMHNCVKEFVGDAEQSDDLTMLMVKYTKEQRAVLLKRSIILPNDVKTVPHLNTFVDNVAKEVGFDESETMNLNLALEEAVVNVMNYAYPLGTKGDIIITAEANDVRLKFTITDHGSPFDPTAKEDADTTLSAEDRPIGGLGIYLVRQLMDSMNYEHVDGCNVLTLRKKLN